MGWFKVDHIAARVRRLGTLSVALIKNGGKNGRVSLRVRLSREVQQVSGLTAGDPVDLQWGDGELAGKALLARTEPAGASQLRWQHPEKPAAVEVRFGALPDGHFPGADGAPTFLKPEKQSAATCRWTVAKTPERDGAAIEITLPKEWFSAPPDGARPVSRLDEVATSPDSVLAPTETKAGAAETGAARVILDAPVVKPAPPRPVEEDKIEQCIALIRKGLLPSEIINRVRCTPQFLNDCEALLSKRSEAEAA